MTTTPSIDYTSRDYLAVRNSMLAAATDPASPLYVPGWTASSESDFGVTLVELFAMQYDVASYYVDRAASEAFITTATQRSSILAIAKLLGYRPSGILPATTVVQFTFAQGTGSVTIPAGTQVTTAFNPVLDQPVIFETDSALTVALNSGNQITATVPATQGEKVSNELIGTATTSPEQSYVLYNSGVLDGSAHIFVNGAEWAYVDYLIDYGPTDTVFTAETDEQGRYFVIFGDGVNGAIPPVGAALTATYRVGIGASGNVTKGAITQLVTPIVNVVSVTNTTDAENGSDAESIEHIRANAPRTFSSQDRAVSLRDYENLALKVSGVAMAKAASIVPTSVVLYIAPVGGGSPSSGLVDAVTNYFDDTRTLAGTKVTVVPPIYIPINIGANGAAVSVAVLPQYRSSIVENAVRQAISDWIAFPRVAFGMRLSLGSLYHSLQSVPGVNYVIIGALYRADDPTPAAEDVVLGQNEIPVLGTVVVSTTGGI